ncbi:adenosylcobinamide-GDP ribazoletransferase [Enterococcus ureasiticus]|uniref:Adenosylcobinamide-GDP ribazoletransferase n=1 Tax=Enterococcus ureasiticus TaxID=903984 RepID=A0A1E5GMD3_9ENTE|nr:adenosylcobinamide-GDP ribazoletransferase [Enterococcus ureasiticus]OEG13863.1 cobalamin 5'-phosphate synthase [Enterococcus ureasiticus]
MIKLLILYLQFFTRIPLPIEIDHGQERFKKGILWFAILGLVIGLVDGLILWGLYWFLQSSILAWIGTLLFDVMLTGAFHMDGLADMCDGLFSSRSKEEMLEIMKDSRVGSNGVLALIFYYIFLIIPIMTQGTDVDIVFLIRLMIALQVVGKAGIVLLFQQMRYAGHTKGLGQLFLGVETWRVWLCQLMALSLIYWLLGLKGCLSYLAVILVSIAYRHLVYQKIGGMNGDTLGAFHCIGQIIFILIFFRN